MGSGGGGRSNHDLLVTTESRNEGEEGLAEAGEGMRDG